MPEVVEAVHAAYGKALLSASASLDVSALCRLRLAVAGCTFDAYFSDPDYAALCARNLAWHEFEDSRPSKFRIYLVDSESLGWPPPLPGPPGRIDRLTFNRDLAAAGLRGAYLHPRVWQIFDSGLSLGVQILPRQGASPPWESGAPLRPFMHWIHAGDAAQLCHAGSVGADGRGVLLVGAGGSGKSGTTLAAVVGGLDTVGDDYCLVREGDTGVLARPLFRILKQDPAGVRRACGSSERRFGQLNWQGKYEIHADQLPRDPFADFLRIGAIVVPRIADGRISTFRPIEAGAVMRAFAPTSAFQLPDGERQSIAFAARLCRRLPCFEMSLSNDAQEIAGSLRSFVRELA